MNLMGRIQRSQQNLMLLGLLGTDRLSIVKIIINIFRTRYGTLSYISFHFHFQFCLFTTSKLSENDLYKMYRTQINKNEVAEYLRKLVGLISDSSNNVNSL